MVDGNRIVRISGSKQAVLDLTGLNVSQRLTAAQTVKKSIGSSLKGDLLSIGGVVAFCFGAIDQFLSGIGQVLLNLMDTIVFIGNMIAGGIYSLIRTAASAVLRGILVPIVGIFAWVITAAIDWGNW